LTFSAPRLTAARDEILPDWLQKGVLHCSMLQPRF
jgi:hypothetical protein